jgi:putative Mn2+ efflux pump MntP
MLTALVCSLDSFFASLGLGLFGCAGKLRRQLVVAFLVCDAAATLCGVFLRPWLLKPVISAGLLLPLLASAFAVTTIVFGRKSLGVLFWVPLLLSVDNFLASLGGGPARTSTSLWLVAVLSGFFAWAGFETARVASPLFSPRNALLAGAAATILAFTLAQ